MALTVKLIEQLDDLVERADDGGPDDDLLLASTISNYWPEMANQLCARPGSHS